MRKQFTIFLILIFVLGLVPINFSIAITQNQIDAEVQIVCTDGDDNWFSGSGTMIDPKGIILTNRHVIDGAYEDTCFIGFIESISQEPNFGTEGNYNLAEVKYYTTTSDMDAAVLYLDNPTNKTYPYINIWDSNSDSLQFGDKIETIGFPGIGGSTITYTSGDFSGFGSLSNGMQNYIKTTALLEHGNSGGAAYDINENFMGIPTGVIKGELGSMGYILSVNSIKNWLTNILGTNYQQKVETTIPEIKNKTVKKQTDITPPKLDRFFVALYGLNEEDKEIFYGGKFGDDTKVTYEFSRIRIGFNQNCNQDICIKDSSGEIKGYYYYFGNNPNAIPSKDGKYISATNLLDYSTMSTVKIPETFTPQLGIKNYFILQAQDQSNNISNPLINFEYFLEGDAYKDIKSVYINGYKNNLFGKLRFRTFDETWEKGGYSFARNDYRIWDESRIFTKHKTLYFYPNYDYSIDGLTYLIDTESEWENNEIKRGISTSDNFVKVSNIDTNKATYLYIKPNKISSENFQSKYRILNIIYEPYLIEDVKDVNFSVIDNELTNKLTGRILLQVEEHGEAYYVNPKDSLMYYMANGDEAYRIMRYLGVGITNNDLDKVMTDKSFAKKHSGKIFLQVEAHGEAYYIDVYGKAHYLKDGSVAYNIMRDLGLGITNSDLNKIPEGNL